LEIGAWPRWSAPDAPQSLALALAPLLDRPLRLKVGLERGLAPEPLIAALQRAWDRRYPSQAQLELELVEPGALAELPALSGPGLRAVGQPLSEAQLREQVEARAPRQRLEVRGQSPTWEGTLPELSVLVPTFGRPRALSGLLSALEQQQGLAFELILVDDGGPEALPADLLHAHPRLCARLLRQSNAGPAEARNQALRHARAPVLLYLNDDAVPAPGLLARHLELQRARPALWQGPFRLLQRWRLDSFSALEEADGLLFAWPRWQPDRDYAGGLFCTGNASAPRAAIEALGGFDTTFRWAGAEDTELGMRLQRELALPMRYDPALECGHDHDLDIPSYLRRQRQLGWSTAWIAHRHGEPRMLRNGAQAPPAPAWWEAVARHVREGRPEAARLQEEMEALIAAERRLGRGATAVDWLRPRLHKVGYLCFAAGMLAWRAGRGAMEPWEG
jgi:GT2 family glycosyltransferase